MYLNENHVFYVLLWHSLSNLDDVTAHPHKWIPGKIHLWRYVYDSVLLSAAGDGIFSVFLSTLFVKHISFRRIKKTRKADSLAYLIFY